jgi:dephospho-CoA kinase
LQQDEISHEEDAVMADTEMPNLPQNPNLGSQLVQWITLAKRSNVANMLIANATASLDMMLLAVHSSLLQLTRIVQRQSVDFTALAHRVLTQAEQSNATSSAKQWASSNADFVSSNPAACAARCDAANYFASSYKSFSAARPGSRTK